MATKSQDELEAPAKVYQLDAVDKKVDDALKLLQDILNQTKGVATHADLEQSRKDGEANAKNYTDEEIKKVHLTYGPMKNNLTWFTRAVIAQGIVIVAQMIIAILIFLSLGK